MIHEDHLNLIRDGVPDTGGVWADFGSGTGAFTLALAELIGPRGQILSVDKNAASLRRQERALNARFPRHQRPYAHYLVADFTQLIDLPPLDGVVMANALHFHRDVDKVVGLIHSYLRSGGRCIIVEYNTNRRNPWVPYPLSFKTWETIARRNSFVKTQLLSTRPSSTFNEIYSAVSIKPG